MEQDFELAGAYVAGVIDGGSSLTVRVGKEKKSRLGYRIAPKISVRRKDPRIIYVVDEWAREHGIHGRVEEKPNDTEFVIEKRDDVRDFLEVLTPYLIVNTNAAKLIIEEIFPRLDQNRHTTKEGFLETMEYVDMVRSDTTSSNHKYDTEYFEELWAEELSDTSQ